LKEGLGIALAFEVPDSFEDVMVTPSGYAAALLVSHRMRLAAGEVESWAGVAILKLNINDKPRCPVVARNIVCENGGESRCVLQVNMKPIRVDVVLLFGDLNPDTPAELIFTCDKAYWNDASDEVAGLVQSA
jgi:hypothetical protein